MQRVCVFLGSNYGAHPAYEQAARAMGAELAARGLELVYGGAGKGCMRVLADAALAAGARVVGVIPRALKDKEIYHPHLDDLEVVGSMHERKARMAELSDAFVALPGGLGTLEELCEVLTWGQLGFHAKPVGVLEVNGFFAPFLAFLEHAAAQGFMRPEHRAMLLSAPTPGALLDACAAYVPPDVPKWIERKESL
jgi:hypothetical protein